MSSFKPRLLVLLILGCLPVAAQSAVAPVAFSQSQDVIPAFSDSGPITLPVAHLQVDVNYAAGKNQRGDLVVVYDPQGRHHFWNYARLYSSSDPNSWLNSYKSGTSSVYVASDKLIEFGVGTVTEHNTQSNGLDDAVNAAIGEIGGNLAMLEQRAGMLTLPLTGGPALVGVTVAMTKALPTFKPIPPEFFCAPYGSKEFKGYCSGPGETIVSISRQGNNWRLVLRSRWDVEVILDQNYNAISSQQLTFPKQ